MKDEHHRKSRNNFLPSVMLVLLILQTMLSFFLVYRVSEEINSLQHDIVLEQADSLATFLHGPLVNALKGEEADNSSTAYSDIKHHLSNLISRDSLLRVAYLIRQIEGHKYILLIDAESKNVRSTQSAKSSTIELQDSISTALAAGKAIVASQTTDPWGTWLSAFSPVRDENTGVIQAVLVLDYPVRGWSNLVLSKIGFITVVIVLIAGLIIYLILLGMNTSKIHMLSTDLNEKDRQLSVFMQQFPGMAFRCNVDTNLSFIFVSYGSKKLIGYAPEELIDNRNITFNTIVATEHQTELQEYFRNGVTEQQELQREFQVITKDNQRKWVFGYGEYSPGKEGASPALEGILFDITEKKKIETEKEFLNTHDSLTRLFNRSYFLEYAMNMDRNGSMPISMILTDINGLGLYNNLFGEQAGDRLVRKAAELVQEYTPENGIAARLKGDEFVMFITSCDEKKAESIVERINQKLNEFHDSRDQEEQNLNFSIGYMTTHDSETDLHEVIKDATKMLHHAKLLNKSSNTSGILESMLMALSEKSGETKSHAVRLACISEKIGERVGLSPSELDDLRLFALLHDIGKIGIDDHILKKPGSLTDDEWEIMKNHPMLGYRIAMSSNELKDIAPYILAHHERWDGTGYPQGLKGTEIPILARILSIADAYDAMTGERCYRTRLTKEEALEEIRKNAGKQFDPKFVQIFLKCVQEDSFDCSNID